MDSPSVCLVGAGVVGRAIAKAHTDAGISVTLADQDIASLTAAVDSLELKHDRWRRSPLETPTGWLPSITLHCSDDLTSDMRPIVIESIPERLDLKQSFFSRAEKHFGESALLCSNTSTLRIASIAEKLASPNRFCGMHFFMPVDKRPAVEVVRAETTSPSTIENAISHVKRLGKEPLSVGDGPGFIVNRLLSPYLNEAMLLLGRGVPEDQIERAAFRYGMPMSPLELIDWIGTRTMFDAGRAFWQAFPSRFDPSPMLAGLIKSKRMGRATGSGVYDYEDGVRSESLPPAVRKLCEKYQRNVARLCDEEVTLILSIPMWIEAALALRERVATSREQFDLAMRGGLGYRSDRTWFEFFDTAGSDRILETIDQFSPTTKSLAAPPELLDALKQSSPTGALDRFAS